MPSRTSSTSSADVQRPRVALALGSGGARGYAHIGVIDELCGRGYDIAGVSGSSMGALVGGLQAAGHLDEFADWAKALTQGAVLRLLDPSFTAAGVLRAEKILDVVREILGDLTVEQLPIPYTAVATDLVTGKSVWLQRGPVDAAIRASIAIPGVIAPHVVDGRLLADGGILDPLPMAPIAAVNADLTVAVDLGGSSDIDGDIDERDDDDQHPTTEWFNRVLRSASELMDTEAVRSLLDRPTARAVLGRFGIADNGNDADDDPRDSDPRDDDPRDDDPRDDDPRDDGPETDDSPESDDLPKLGSFEVMNRSIDIAQAALTRHHLAIYPPDLLIKVPRTACRSLDFHRADEVIDLGRQLAAQALDAADRPD